MIQREPIFAALFAKLQGIAGAVTVSRRLLHWADVPAEARPAIFLAQAGEQAIARTGMPTVWQLGARVYLYVQSPDLVSPSAVMNPLIDAICASLAPDLPRQENCTLGGLVEYCRIEGQIETDEGTLGDQAVAILPIQILTYD